MDQETKAKFLLAVHKHTLAHFDQGGAPALSGGVQNGVSTYYNQLYNPSTWVSDVSHPGQAVSGIGSAVGGIPQGIASGLTAQNTYQANLAPVDYTNYGSAIDQAAGNAFAGYGNAQGIQAQQQGLANQLQAETLGAGPNPAQSALATNTGQNIASQAALAAGQRGAGSNVGLIARQNAMQGAATQQGAIGQAATLQAQQQLAAQGQLQSQQQNIAGNNISEQGVNANLFGTAAGAQNTQNSNQIQNYGMAQGINSQVAQNNANAVNKTESGLLGGGASALSSMFARGGKVEMPEHLEGMHSIYHAQGYANGGGVGESASVNIPNLMAPVDSSSSSGSGSSGGGIAGLASLAALLNKGGKVDPMLSTKGGTVKTTGPGQKAVEKGDSLKNDKIPALLSDGEHVIDRETMEDPGPLGKAARFVAAAIAAKNRGKK